MRLCSDTVVLQPRFLFLACDAADTGLAIMNYRQHRSVKHYSTLMEPNLVVMGGI